MRVDAWGLSLLSLAQERRNLKRASSEVDSIPKTPATSGFDAKEPNSGNKVLRVNNGLLEKGTTVYRHA